MIKTKPRKAHLPCPSCGVLVRSGRLLRHQGRCPGEPPQRVFVPLKEIEMEMAKEFGR